MALWDPTFEAAPVGGTDLASTGDESIAGVIPPDAAWGLKSEVRFRREVGHYWVTGVAGLLTDPAGHEESGRHMPGTARSFFQGSFPLFMPWEDYDGTTGGIAGGLARPRSALDDGRLLIRHDEDFKLYIFDRTTTNTWLQANLRPPLLEDLGSRLTAETVGAAATTITLAPANPAVTIPDYGDWSIHVTYNAHLSTSSTGGFTGVTAATWIEEDIVPPGAGFTILPDSFCATFLDRQNVGGNRSFYALHRSIWVPGINGATHTFRLRAQRGAALLVDLNGQVDETGDETETHVHVVAEHLASGDVSIDLDGVNEDIETTNNVNVNVANAWSVMCWVKTDTTAGAGRTFFDIEDSGSLNNNILLRANTPGAGDLRLGAVNSTGGALWDGTVVGMFSAGTWYHIVWTWDGVAFAVYVDGVDVTPAAAVGLGGMSNTTRQILIGYAGGGPSHWDGRLYQFAIWNSVLTLPEAISLYSSGQPNSLDLNSNFGSYTSSANLQWWFRFGQDSSFIPRNYASSPPVVLNVGDWSSPNDPIDVADIVRDYPR